nr:UBN2 domain-containing protein [Tanacetum cinerariifolium]
MIIKKDYEIVKAKGERKSISLKAKKESSDEECLTSKSEYEEYVMAVRDFKKFFKKTVRFVRQPRNDKRTFKRSRDNKNDKNQREFVGGSWSVAMKKMMKKSKTKCVSWLKHQMRDLILKRKEERSINNHSFLGEYECSSLALDREERREEKKRLDRLKQDQKILEALDEGFSSKNYVRKFFRALHLKWRAKVTVIEESKDLSSLALDELIGNLKVHEVIMEKNSKFYKGKKERVESIALKAKKESSNDETLTSGSDEQ